MPSPTISVVLPCLDEIDSIGECVDAAREGLDRADLDGEVLVVDNGSADGSITKAGDHGARVVHAPVRGYGSALLTGIAHASGAILVMADADGTYDLSRLGDLVEPVINNEADLVLGSRFDGVNRGTMPLLHRLIGTPVLSFLLRRATGGLRVRDSQSGYRAFRTNTVRVLGLKATGMEFASEMLIRASNQGLRIAETPMGYRPRTGESKLRTLTDGLRHLQLILMLAPQLLLFWPGVGALLAGAALATLTLLRPEGFGVGTLSWQPVFLTPILLVMGTIGALAGAVVTHHSTLAAHRTQQRFRFVANPRFFGTTMLLGAGLVIAGIVVEVALFSAWVRTGGSPAFRLAVAGLAQALILMGAVLAAFGIVYRIVQMGGAYRTATGGVDVDLLRSGDEPQESAG